MTDVAEGGPRTRHQVEMDVHHDLALDPQVDVVDQPVDRGADRSLDPVLYRHEAEIHLAGGHGVEHRGDRHQRLQIDLGQVGLGEEGLLGEGGSRAEIRHRGRRGVHGWAG